MAGQHTPGPWEAGHYSSVVGLPVVAQPDPTQNTIIICGVRGNREEAEANARLIAAAPDLFAALAEVAVLGHGKCTIGKPLAEMIRAAISKALSSEVTP